MNRTRDEFGAATKETLARRVGFHCSNPACWQMTSGPADDPNKSVNIGVAAHITAASAEGPRFDLSLTSDQRRSIDNGIWLCQNCGKLVDSDLQRFTVDQLCQWRRWAEGAALQLIGGGPRGRSGAFLAYLGAPLPPADTVPEPGPLPPGFRMPLARNALFTGRAESLKEVAHRLLYETTGPALVTQAVAGMGGVGKTQLAAELAYRYGRYFVGVHWVNAAQPDGIGAEVAACGLAMRLADWPEKLPEQIERTIGAWGESGPRLVVLDNLEDAGAAGEWLARLGAGGCARLLVTARRSVWPRELGLAPLRLPVFSPEESRAYLRRYVGEERASDGELDALAERLGRLPLALRLAGRYLDSDQSLTARGYLEELGVVLDHPAMKGWLAALGNLKGQDLDLAASFAKSWARVTDEGARRVFAAAAWCAPNEPIPGELLARAAGLDAPQCGGAVSLLVGLGLLEREEGDEGPLIHPLLAEFGRQIHAALGRKLDAPPPALASALADLAYEADMTGLPARFLPLRPHVEAAAAWAEQAVPARGLRGWSRPGRCGTTWATTGTWSPTMPGRGRRTSGPCASTSGPTAPTIPTVAIRVNNLGGVLKALGDLAGARAAYERALRHLAKALPARTTHTSPSTSTTWGVCCRTWATWPGRGRRTSGRCASGRRRLGPDHPQVASGVNNLGSVLQALGDLAGARAAFERALRIDERAYGPDHPDVATDVNNLGGVLQALGDLAGARAAYERALRIDERAYGPDHPDVAIDVNNLGGVLQALGDLAGARAAFERALRIDEQAFGPDHPHVASDVNNLGLVLQALGDLAGARAAFERALRIFVKFLPADHPNIRIVRGNLAGLP